MATLQSTNVIGSLCVNGVAIGGGGKDFKICCFTASANWTPPSDLVTGDGLVETVVIGGGGGGGAGMTRNTCGSSCGRCIAPGQGAAGGVDGGLKIMTSSNDACVVTIGTGGNSGSFTCDFSTFTICSAATPSTKGGNSCALGYIGYGGGAGAIAGCSQGRYSICCDVNSFGGPAGGTIKITGYHSIAPCLSLNCQGIGTMSNGGMCSDNTKRYWNGQKSGNFSPCAFGCSTCLDRSCCAMLSSQATFNLMYNITDALICTVCSAQQISGSAPWLMSNGNPLYQDMCHDTVPRPPYFPPGHYGHKDSNGVLMAVPGAVPYTENPLPGQAIGQSSSDRNCISASNYGNGGYGSIHGQNSDGCFISCAGSAGVNGIVILKWNE